jgi:hypothetical protein
VHSLPALIASKRARDCRPTVQFDHPLEILPISNIIDTFHYHALLYYQEGAYKLIPITHLLLNSLSLNPNKRLLQLLVNSDRPIPQIVHDYLRSYLDPNYIADES